MFPVALNQDKLDKDDLLIALQNYVFAHTKSFERAADDCRVKLGLKATLSEEIDETDEPEKEQNDNEPNNSEGSGSSISTAILEVPQNPAFSENNQRL